MVQVVETSWGPADTVTLLRLGLVCVVLGLVVEGGPAAPVVVVSAVALALDAVDGRVARATGTASAFGAAFDMEVDALLVLVLSVRVAPEVGVWVLLIGAARYLLGAAALLVPWLRRPVPVRRWAKVVAAVQGVTLTVVAAGVLPVDADRAVLLVALLLLAESFAHQVRWLAAHRPVPVSPALQEAVR